MNYTTERPPEEALYDLVQRTEISPLTTVGEATIHLANETIQSTRAFKLRGALYATLCMGQRSPELLQNGLVTASAGNHAQGVALAAAYQHISADIFLPNTAAPGKVAAITAYGAEVHFTEGTVDDALEVAEKYAANSGKLFIHPFNDPLVIRGQATLGEEIVDDPTEFKTVFVPVGGGGLLAGVGAVLARRSPTTQIFGVQLEGCDAFAKSIEAGKLVELTNINSLADGTAVRRVGNLTLQSVLANPSFGGIIRVTPQELGAALTELDDTTDIVAETAAGLSYAGLLKHLQDHAQSSGNHLAVISGGHRDEERAKQLMAA